ncbi:acyl carrier protein [Frankia sp. AgKG'84/4]|uniref:acyl carrier protein n=1 Tax=Frankia sp. AgKG'84/4 TaxID=573490 RepID=UPI00200BA4F9|nr:acyl carrier protein [Frankia sp. AgKG'84/4]MCL9794657.1 acyl carrier protein [Frankia sp. AgKG'84/4]
MAKMMTIDELRAILVDCAGGDDAVLPGDISAVPFDELGYDSLALIETAARLRLDHDVLIPDEEIAEVRTAGELLGKINDRIAV